MNVSFSMEKLTPHYYGQRVEGVPIYDNNIRAAEPGAAKPVAYVKEDQPLLFIKNDEMNLDGSVTLVRDVDGDGAISSDDISKSTEELSGMLEKNGLLLGGTLAHMGYFPMILSNDGGYPCKYTIPLLSESSGLTWVEDMRWTHLYGAEYCDTVTLDALKTGTATTGSAKIHIGPKAARAYRESDREIAEDYYFGPPGCSRGGVGDPFGQRE